MTHKTISCASTQRCVCVTNCPGRGLQSWRCQPTHPATPYPKTTLSSAEFLEDSINHGTFGNVTDQPPNPAIPPETERYRLLLEGSGGDHKDTRLKCAAPLGPTSKRNFTCCSAPNSNPPKARAASLHAAPTRRPRPRPTPPTLIQRAKSRGQANLPSLISDQHIVTSKTRCTGSSVC